MGSASTVIRRWLKSASPDQARQLAKAAKTSVPHLRHIGAGRRAMSADMAQRIAHASKRHAPALLLIQTDLCAACARCPLI